MLERLRIRHLVVVEDAELEFKRGFNALTGTTGAGKSLILSAVNLLLGEKASTSAIREGEDHALVEGVFSGSLVANAWPNATGSRVVLRREIRRNGRSYAFVNDQPVTIRELQRVCSALIEPHGQHEQFRLRDPETHVHYVDAYARNDEERRAYSEAFAVYESARRTLRDFDLLLEKARTQEALYQQRLAELDELRPEANELDELSDRLAIAENAERIASALHNAWGITDGDHDNAAAATVQSAASELTRVSGDIEALNGWADRLDEAAITLRDIADEIRRFLDGMEFDPESVEAMRERRDELIAFERRHRMTVSEFLEHAPSWRLALEQIDDESGQRQRLQSEVDESAESLQREAEALRATRREAAAQLDRAMTDSLSRLQMAGAAFRTDIGVLVQATSPIRLDGEPVAVNETGADVVRFYVRTNAGAPEGPVERIASTGEVSRMALAIKSIATPGKPGSVLIFDEIDAGVGADLGVTLGEKLLELSRSYQIICITHMPQIAAMATHHAVVSKTTDQHRTFVSVASVDGEGRRQEIVRMLGGTDGGAQEFALADELISRGLRSSKSPT